MKWLSPSPSAIGLDLGARRIKAVQLHGSNPTDGAQAMAFDRHASLEGVELAAHVLRVLRRRGFKGRRLVIMAPRELCRVAPITIPKSDGPLPIESMARMEAIRTHQLTPGQCEVAWWELPQQARAKKQTTVMTVSLEHKRIDPLLDAFEAAGFDVVAVDVPACALVRALRPMLRSTDSVNVVLDIGWSACQMVAHCDGVVVYERVIAENGLERLYAGAVEALGEDAAVVHQLLVRSSGGDRHSSVNKLIRSFSRRLIEDLRACADYACRQVGRDWNAETVATGGGVALPALVDQIREDIRFDPASMPNVMSMPQHTDPGLVMAFGLAMHGLERAA